MGDSMGDTPASAAAAASFDVALLTVHQSIAFRVVAYASATAEGRPSLVPPGLCTAAEEPGPRTDHDGPCLALLTGLRLPPSDVVSWFAASRLSRHADRLFFLDARRPPLEAGDW